MRLWRVGLGVGAGLLVGFGAGLELVLYGYAVASPGFFILVTLVAGALAGSLVAVRERRRAGARRRQGLSPPPGGLGQEHRTATPIAAGGMQLQISSTVPSAEIRHAQGERTLLRGKATSTRVKPLGGPEVGHRVLPFTLVVDASASMAGRAIGAINAGLTAIHEEMSREPELANVAHISVVRFSDEAQTLLELTDLRSVPRLPVISAGGAADYAAVFRHLRKKLDADRWSLGADARKSLRPTVFLLLGSRPSVGDWEVEYRALVSPDFRAHPTILAFGFGDADEAVIGKVGTIAAYMAETGRDAVLSLNGSLEAFLNSAMQSAAIEVAGEGGALALPDRVPGWRTIRLASVK
jgi:uncharacterized protein YegL